MFTVAESIACRRLIELGLEEDLGAAGDLTSLLTIPENSAGAAAIVARAPGTLAGLPAAAMVAARVDARLRFRPGLDDGAPLEPGQQVARIEGPMRGILAAERLALNFVQHLSGVATLTHRFVQAAAGLPVKILDTRKTLPGWRLLEKYAVRCGGGHNHRIGLFDGILIKDNHLAALGSGPQAIREAVRKARERNAGAPVEIEVESLDELEIALDCRPDIVLVDNMAVPQLREAAERRNAKAPQVQLEASGGVSLETIRAIAESGVDRISVGAITHSAPALDLALDYL
jgi:nicotinate-nucleotide pyrophosphorylase (carboxylating)